MGKRVIWTHTQEAKGTGWGYYADNYQRHYNYTFLIPFPLAYLNSKCIKTYMYMYTLICI